MLESLIADIPDVAKYFSIPLVAGLIGWFTNWLAITLTFSPKRFIGIRPYLGWQGIIPRKSRKLSKILVDNVLELMPMSVMFEHMEPQKLIRQIVDNLRPHIDEFVDEVMLEHYQVLWENLPIMMKNRVYVQAHRQLPRVVDDLIEDIADNIDRISNLESLVAERFREDPELINRIFRETGAQGFRAIILSGLGFGFFFGIAQMLICVFYPSWWTLSLGGFSVGFATNWLALKIVFGPDQPRSVGPYKFLGMFPRRQQQVSAQFCSIFTHEIMSVENLLKHLMTGNRAKHMRLMIRKNSEPIVDAFSLKAFAQLTIGPSGFVNVKNAVTNKALEIYQIPFHDTKFNEQRAELLESALTQRMANLSAEQFKRLLRPAFREDEWILLYFGGIVGGLVGLAQAALIFQFPVF